MKKIAYLAENFGSFASPLLKEDALMHYSGHNVGNFAFWNAFKSLFAGEVRLFHFGAKQDFFKRGDIDLVCIPAANFLNETADLGWLSKIIDYLDKPVFIVGLGAQSEHEEKIPVLKQGTIDFLRSVSVRTPFICVRGPFSKKVCEAYGINNVKVLGCPSLFMNSNNGLAQEIKSKWNMPIEKLAVHAASIKQHVQGAERFIFSKLLIPSFSSYILQRPVELMKLCLGTELSESEDVYLSKLNNFLAPDMDLKDFKKTIRLNGYIPYSIESWRFFLRTHTHSLGTRIHGSMLSISAGLPTICITHDTRTRELCEVMKIPNISHKKILNYTSLFDVFNSVYDSFIPDEFELNRKNLAAQYIGIMNDLELDVSDVIMKFKD